MFLKLHPVEALKDFFNLSIASLSKTPSRSFIHWVESGENVLSNDHFEYLLDNEVSSKGTQVSSQLNKQQKVFTHKSNKTV